MLLYIAAASDGSHRRRCSGIHRERGSPQHQPHAACAIVQVVGRLLSGLSLHVPNNFHFV
jgi:hypothetical protein